MMLTMRALMLAAGSAALFLCATVVAAPVLVTARRLEGSPCPESKCNRKKKSKHCNNKEGCRWVQGPPSVCLSKDAPAGCIPNIANTRFWSPAERATCPFGTQPVTTGAECKQYADDTADPSFGVDQADGGCCFVNKKLISPRDTVEYSADPGTCAAWAAFAPNDDDDYLWRKRLCKPDCGKIVNKRTCFKSKQTLGCRWKNNICLSKDAYKGRRSRSRTRRSRRTSRG